MAYDSLYEIPIGEDEFMTGKELEFFEKEPLPDPEIKELMDEEIAHTPQAPHELLDRVHANNEASPADAGGDVDADWEDVSGTGAETVFGHNPTPGQSDVEENAHAMGIDFQDNEPLDLLEKIEKRDRNRFELDEASKSESDMI